nr:MAG TPA: Hepatocyte nuclear factor 4-alpha, Nuclear Factor, Transcription-DNA complex [Caudoviricetes sp.]DAN63488.1 MAG TPA: Hepatocyte nuclear factor 4-alpha, Nuclear Factor, Transcription-DNA complex [Caudoviricetes sp.]
MNDIRSVFIDYNVSIICKYCRFSKKFSLSILNQI